MSNHDYKKLPGGPGGDSVLCKTYNQPSRKNQRNLLYERLRQEIKRNRSMTSYDVYRVLQSLKKKLRRERYKK